MIYLDRDLNPIGESIGEARGWIEATKYYGELYVQHLGFQPFNCTWQFARQWWQDASPKMGTHARTFIRQYEGDKDEQE
jgi:hypothetical protein